MKAKVLLIAAALLLFAASSFGQGGVDPFSYVVLTHPCNGTDALPDGTPIYVYWDNNSDGPSAGDPLLPLCAAPPECGTGPTGTWNFNEFPLNGEAINGVAGTFYAENYLSIVAADPSPNRLYLRVYYPNFAEWTTQYTSPIFLCGVAGAMIESEITTWTCRDTLREQPCTETPLVSFVPDLSNPTPGGFPQIPPQHKCITVCPNGSTVISIGPVVNSPLHPRLPNVIITPGCTVDCPGTCVETTNGSTNPSVIPPLAANWALVQNAGLWYYQATIHGVTRGCVCVTFDFLLPVEMGDVTLTALSNKAELKWNTRSENSLARFDIVRDGEVIGFKAANNTPTGANYVFVDETAENGHIYTYTLRVIGLDGTVDEVYSGKAAPSIGNAKPTEYALLQNYPNPFNPTTTISFDIVDTNPVTLTVYNANGQLVATLLSNVSKDAGRYNVNFDATNLTSGLYFYTVKVGNVYTATKKMLLVK